MHTFREFCKETTATVAHKNRKMIKTSRNQWSSKRSQPAELSFCPAPRSKCLWLSYKNRNANIVPATHGAPQNQRQTYTPCVQLHKHPKQLSAVFTKHTFLLFIISSKKEGKTKKNLSLIFYSFRIFSCRGTVGGIYVDCRECMRFCFFIKKTTFDKVAKKSKSRYFFWKKSVTVCIFIWVDGGWLW